MTETFPIDHPEQNADRETKTLWCATDKETGEKICFELLGIKKGLIVDGKEKYRRLIIRRVFRADA